MDNYLFTWAPTEGAWSPVTEDGGTAPLPGTTVVAPASAILMTLASSTLFMTIEAKAMLHGAPPRLHQDHFWIDLEEEILLHNGVKMSLKLDLRGFGISS